MFGRGKRRAERLEREGRLVCAEILGVEYGRVVRTRTVGQNSSVSARRTVRVRVEGPDGEYEAELKLGPGDAMVPDAPGTRVELLVSVDDSGEIAVPRDAVFTMPNGAEWRPPANAGIGRGGEAAALEEMKRIREAAERG